MKRLVLAALLVLGLTSCRSTVEVYDYGSPISQETMQEVKSRVPNQYIHEDYDNPIPNWDSPRRNTTN